MGGGYLVLLTGSLVHDLGEHLAGFQRLHVVESIRPARMKIEPVNDDLPMSIPLDHGEDLARRPHEMVRSVRYHRRRNVNRSVASPDEVCECHLRIQPLDLGINQIDMHASSVRHIDHIECFPAREFSHELRCWCKELLASSVQVALQLY